MLEDDTLSQLEPFDLKAYLGPPALDWIDENVLRMRELIQLAAEILRTHPLAREALGPCRRRPNGGLYFTGPERPVANSELRAALASVRYLANYLDGGSSNPAIDLFAYLGDAERVRRLRARIETSHATIHEYETIRVGTQPAA